MPTASTQNAIGQNTSCDHNDTNASCDHNDAILFFTPTPSFENLMEATNSHTASQMRSSVTDDDLKNRPHLSIQPQLASFINIPSYSSINEDTANNMPHITITNYDQSLALVELFKPNGKRRRVSDSENPSTHPSTPLISKPNVFKQSITPLTPNPQLG